MTRTNLLSVIIISVIWMPWLPVASGFPEVRLEWLLLSFGLILFPVSRTLVGNPVVSMGLVVLVSYAVSQVIGIVAMDVPFNLKDTTEYLKPLLYVFLYVFIISGSYRWEHFTKLMQILITALALSCTLTIIQFFRPDAIAGILYLYRADLDEMYAYQELRSWGTMGNPNDMGIVSALGFGIVLFSLNLRIIPVKVSWLLLFITFFSVFTTGSRTGILALAAILGYFGLFELRKSFWSILSYLVILLFINQIFDSIFAKGALEGIEQRITSLTNLVDDVAWSERLYHVENGLLLIAQNPIFGIGPSKSLYEDMGSLDNEYITILFRYGLVGLIATAAFVRVLAFGAIKQKAAFYRTMRNLAGALLVAIALFAYTAASYGNFRIMFLIIIISALPASVKLLPSQRPNAA